MAAEKEILHLLYVSTASKLMSAETLDDILGVSRRNNGVAELSGMLVYGGGNFMQLLEGSPETVEATFDRISRDTRHHEVTRIISLESPERWCGDWEMGFARYEDDRPIEGFVNLVGRQNEPLPDLKDDNIAARLMRGFVEGNR